MRAHLRLAVESRLQRTKRLNLCGILLATTYIVYRENKAKISFIPKMSLEFIDNTSYLGSMHARRDEKSSRNRNGIY